MSPLIPLFFTSGDVSSGFQSQSTWVKLFHVHATRHWWGSQTVDLSRLRRTLYQLSYVGTAEDFVLNPVTTCQLLEKVSGNEEISREISRCRTQRWICGIRDKMLHHLDEARKWGHASSFRNMEQTHGRQESKEYRDTQGIPCRREEGTDDTFLNNVEKTLLGFFTYTQKCQLGHFCLYYVKNKKSSNKMLPPSWE